MKIKQKEGGSPPTSPPSPPLSLDNKSWLVFGAASAEQIIVLKGTKGDSAPVAPRRIKDVLCWKWCDHPPSLQWASFLHSDSWQQFLLTVCVFVECAFLLYCYSDTCIGAIPQLSHSPLTMEWINQLQTDYTKARQQMIDSCPRHSDFDTNPF